MTSDRFSQTDFTFWTSRSRSSYSQIPLVLVGCIYVVMDMCDTIVLDLMILNARLLFGVLVLTFVGNYGLLRPPTTLPLVLVGCVCCAVYE
jgi:hypothetical protein